MKLRTGLKTLIALSLAGIAVAILLVFTCPFAGVISFNTLVHEGGGHAYERLTVHATAIPGVRNLPAKEAGVFGTEVSFLGIVVLLGVIALCAAVLRGKRFNLFGYTVTPQSMGLAVRLVTIWNVLFSAFLIATEVLVLKEIWLVWVAFDAAVAAMLVVAPASFTTQLWLLRLKRFDTLEA